MRGVPLNVEALFRKHKQTKFEQYTPEREKVTDDDAALIAALEGSLAEAKANRGRNE